MTIAGLITELPANNILRTQMKVMFPTAHVVILISQRNSVREFVRSLSFFQSNLCPNPTVPILLMLQLGNLSLQSSRCGDRGIRIVPP
jgi:hypothetical protein